MTRRRLGALTLLPLIYPAFFSVLVGAELPIPTTTLFVLHGGTMLLVALHAPPRPAS